MAEPTAYLCPSGYLAGSEHRRDIYYAARALDNTMYVVFAELRWRGGPWAFNGGAAVYEPEGRALVKAPDYGSGVVTATLDPVELARVRQRTPCWWTGQPGPWQVLGDRSSPGVAIVVTVSGDNVQYGQIAHRIAPHAGGGL